MEIVHGKKIRYSRAKVLIYYYTFFPFQINKKLVIIVHYQVLARAF